MLSRTFNFLCFAPPTPHPSRFLGACPLCVCSNLCRTGTHALRSQRLVIGLVGAMFIMLVELLVFVTRSLKADEVLEAARQVTHTRTHAHAHMWFKDHQTAPRPNCSRPPHYAGWLPANVA